MHLLIVSGKGGTGKTTLAATFSQLSGSKLIIDCDVEASNLHLLLARDDLARHPFSGAKLAKQLDNECTACGLCTAACRFGAINNGVIDALRCEGCGACVFVCPVDHLVLEPAVTGQTVLSATDYGIMSRAEMQPGAEGSGKLVTEIRRQGRLATQDIPLTLLDGPPGIGCAVIASMTGCQLALVVAEASFSGISDAERVVDLLRQMDVRTMLCINRADISPELSQQLEQLCVSKGVSLVGEIPYDPVVREAQCQGRSLLDFPESPATKAILAIWDRINEEIGEEQ